MNMMKQGSTKATQDGLCNDRHPLSVELEEFALIWKHMYTTMNNQRNDVTTKYLTEFLP